MEIRRLSPHDIAQQQAGSTRIAPGIWLDASGGVHFSVPELLEMVDLEDNATNREAVVRIATEIARSNNLTAIRQEVR